MRTHDKVTGEGVSDDILASRVAHGELQALETLYDRYACTVLGISVKILGDQAEAEDVLQETFWQLWRRAASYQAQRGTLGPFSGWLFRIARQLAIDCSCRRKTK